jgi:hypothetical protein
MRTRCGSLRPAGRGAAFQRRSDVSAGRYGDVVLWHYAFARHWFTINLTTGLSGQIVETGGDEPGSRFAFNCDIATPMRRRGDVVYAVDLFTDVRVRVDGVTCRVCDLEELEQARRRELISPGEADGAGRGLAISPPSSSAAPCWRSWPGPARPGRWTRRPRPRAAAFPSRRFRCSVPETGPSGPGGTASGLPQPDAAHIVTGGRRAADRCALVLSARPRPGSGPRSRLAPRPARVAWSRSCRAGVRSAPGRSSPSCGRDPCARQPGRRGRHG